jgi:hypothetical protein
MHFRITHRKNKMKFRTFIFSAAALAFVIAGASTRGTDKVEPLVSNVAAKSDRMPAYDPDKVYRLSDKCGRQIMNHSATPECEEEGRRWHASLKKRLQDPAFRKQIEEYLK